MRRTELSFENLIGNERIKENLKKSIKSNNILHSYIFVGISGIGKRIFAREFAKSILCLNEDKYCNKCKSCMEFQSNNHPDFMEIERAEDSKNIKIEQIRFMQEKIAEKPIISSKKVYIIDDADTMTIEAQNCLLKTLEEPPEYAVIILIVSNESKLLNTIKSRCIKIPFEMISDDNIKKYIEDNITKDVSKNMISMCGGSIGKAKIIEERKEIYINLEEVIDNMNKMDQIDILNKSEILYKSKDNIQELLDYINIILYNKKDIRYINCIQIVEDTKRRLLQNSNYDMSIDRLLIKMWENINY